MNKIYNKYELILIASILIIVSFLLYEFQADNVTAGHIAKIETLIGNQMDNHENKLRYMINGEYYSFEVSKECSAIHVISIFMILIPGTPNVSVIRKIIYIPIAFVILWTVNILRLVMNFELATTREFFILFHGVASQIIMFFVMLMVFYLWLQF